MSIQALLLIVAAAILHAWWNLVTKKVNGGLAFFWIMALMSCLVCLPFVAWQLVHTGVTITAAVLLLCVGSAVFHLVYFIVLQAGYRKADLSVVYPLARGSGPLISVTGAVFILHETPGIVGVFGIVLILAGVLVMTGVNLNKTTDAKLKAGIFYGILTGLFIASYTLWDRVAVVDKKVPGLLITFASMLLPLIVLTPVAVKQWSKVKEEATTHWKQSLVVAVCQPLSYLLVLIALKTTPVSYVAPARELSIVFGVFFGANVLKENDAKRRIIAAAIMLLGIALLAV